jgi:hypothetical protein
MPGAALIVLLAYPSALFAGNSRSFFLGDEAALTGGAGIAVSADSGSLWYNPAGLGGLALGRMELTGTIYSAKLRKANGILKAHLPSGTYSSGTRADDFGSVPTSLVFVRHGNDRILYGLAWYDTFTDSGITFEQAIPMEAQLGVVYQRGKNWLGAEATVRPPLYDEGQTLLWNASVGGRLALSPVLSWGAGIFTDNSGEKRTDDALRWRSDRYGFTTGMEFKTPLMVKGSRTGRREGPVARLGNHRRCLLFLRARRAQSPDSRRRRG